MHIEDRLITIYFHPDRLSHRQTIAYAQSMAPFVEAYSFEDANLNMTRWEHLLELLDVADPRLLINEEDPYYKAELKGHDFDRASWLKILVHNPQLIKAPIAVRGDHAILCCLPNQVLRLVTDKVEMA